MDAFFARHRFISPTPALCADPPPAGEGEAFYSAASTRFFFMRAGLLRASTGFKNAPV
jgi:hypothetical protein